MPSRFLPASLRAAAAVVIVAVPVAVAGCPDPEQTFDEFGERYELTDPQTQSVTVTVGPVGGCQLPTVGNTEFDGTYLFALSAFLKNATPFLFETTITTVEGGPAGVSLNVVLQPLGTPYRDGTPALQPVGSPIDLGDLPLNEDGTFDVALDEIRVAGDANAITARDLVATVSLAGTVCANADVEGDGLVRLGFFCGTFSGTVAEPVQLELDPTKNFFSFTKYDGEIPEPVIYDCAGSEAEPFDG